MNFKEALTTLPQYVLPHHALSANDEQTDSLRKQSL